MAVWYFCSMALSGYIARLLKKDPEKEVLTVFEIGLVLKGINGAIEMLAALLIALVPPHFVVRIAEIATQGEIANDGDDPIALYIRDAAHTFAIRGHLLLTAYLFLHGIVKLLLVWGIFAKKRAAYPLFMLALALFGSYEVYRGLVRHETILLALALFDITLFVITAHEYRRILRGTAADRVQKA